MNIVDFQDGRYFVSREALASLDKDGRVPARHLLPVLALDHRDAFDALVNVFAPDWTPVRALRSNEAAHAVFGAAALGLGVARHSLVEVARRVDAAELAKWSAPGRIALRSQAGVTSRFPSKLLRMKGGHTVRFWRDSRDAVRLEVDVPLKLFDGVAPRSEMTLVA